MKQIRLTATEPMPEISIDLSGSYHYEKDADGADLLCGHCGEVMFAAHPLSGEDSIHIEGVKCQSCGGTNTLDTASLK
ncbi:hypothetical protein [Brucella anthropi]|uniref:hypothetical protein n=1 Tax=Brucella anthropi TaxID=529 RepID=UPI000AFE7D83|nr:hypothetical protein [Brucella anthropi]